MKNLSLSIGDNKIEIGSGRKIDLLHILAIIHYIVKTGNGRCGAVCRPIRSGMVANFAGGPSASLASGH